MSAVPETAVVAVVVLLAGVVVGVVDGGIDWPLYNVISEKSKQHTHPSEILKPEMVSLTGS